MRGDRVTPPPGLHCTKILLELQWGRDRKLYQMPWFYCMDCSGAWHPDVYDRGPDSASTEKLYGDRLSMEHYGNHFSATILSTRR